MKIKAAEELIAIGVAAAAYAGLWYLPNWQVEHELARARAFSPFGDGS